MGKERGGRRLDEGEGGGGEADDRGIRSGGNTASKGTRRGTRAGARTGRRSTSKSRSMSRGLGLGPGPGAKEEERAKTTSKGTGARALAAASSQGTLGWAKETLSPCTRDRWTAASVAQTSSHNCAIYYVCMCVCRSFDSKFLFFVMCVVYKLNHKPSAPLSPEAD